MSDLSKIVLPYEQGYELALNAIDAYLEHRDKFGYGRDDARVKAAAEFAEGMSIDVHAELDERLDAMCQDSEAPL